MAITEADGVKNYIIREESLSALRINLANTYLTSTLPGDSDRLIELLEIANPLQ